MKSAIFYLLVLIINLYNLHAGNKWDLSQLKLDNNEDVTLVSKLLQSLNELKTTNNLNDNLAIVKTNIENLLAAKKIQFDNNLFELAIKNTTHGRITFAQLKNDYLNELEEKSICFLGIPQCSWNFNSIKNSDELTELKSLVDSLCNNSSQNQPDYTNKAIESIKKIFEKLNIEEPTGNIQSWIGNNHSFNKYFLLKEYYLKPLQKKLDKFLNKNSDSSSSDNDDDNYNYFSCEDEHNNSETENDNDHVEQSTTINADNMQEIDKNCSSNTQIEFTQLNFTKTNQNEIKRLSEYIDQFTKNFSGAYIRLGLILDQIKKIGITSKNNCLEQAIQEAQNIANNTEINDTKKREDINKLIQNALAPLKIECDTFLKQNDSSNAWFKPKIIFGIAFFSITVYWFLKNYLFGKNPA